MSNEEIGLSRNWLHVWELSKTCFHFSIKIRAAVNYLYSWRERRIDNVTKYRTQSYATASLLGLLSDNWINVMLIAFFFLWVHKYYVSLYLYYSTIHSYPIISLTPHPKKCLYNLTEIPFFFVFFQSQNSVNFL